MIILKVKQKGYFITIPGIAPFRTPADIDITKCKLSLVLSTLKNNGVVDYEIVSKGDKAVVYKREDFDLTKKENENKLEIDERLRRIEYAINNIKLQKTFSDGSNKKRQEEQITNKLKVLEDLAKKVLERESVREIVYTTSKDVEGQPIVEELDEDPFIPDIDLSNLKLKGSSSETIESTDDAEEAADMLSRLKQ